MLRIEVFGFLGEFFFFVLVIVGTGGEFSCLES